MDTQQDLDAFDSNGCVITSSNDFTGIGVDPQGAGECVVLFSEGHYRSYISGTITSGNPVFTVTVGKTDSNEGISTVYNGSSIEAYYDGNLLNSTSVDPSFASFFQIFVEANDMDTGIFAIFKLDPETFEHLDFVAFAEPLVPAFDVEAGMVQFSILEESGDDGIVDYFQAKCPVGKWDEAFLQRFTENFDSILTFLTTFNRYVLQPPPLNQRRPRPPRLLPSRLPSQLPRQLQLYVESPRRLCLDARIASNGVDVSKMENL